MPQLGYFQTSTSTVASHRVGLLVLLLLVGSSLNGRNSVSAFTIVSSNSRRTFGTTPALLRLPMRRKVVAPGMKITVRALAATTATTQEPAIEETTSALERELGIKDGQLALGVDPNEVLKYIGTREDLIAKTLQDIPSFTRAAAEVEVDKFLLDAEAVNMFINFGKAKEDDPDFEVPAPPEEGFFSFRTLVVGYLGYVAVTSAPVVFRKWVAKQQDAGTWEGTNLPFVDDWIANTPVPVKEAADVASDVLSTAAAGASADAAAQAASQALEAASTALP